MSSPSRPDQRVAPLAHYWLFRQAPNFLTSIRLGLGLLFPLLPRDYWLPVVIVAAITEFLDGALARFFRLTSITGQILDPIADKVFVLAVLLTLTAAKEIQSWQLLLVASRDILVLMGSFAIALRHGMKAITRLPPMLLGKLATTAQLSFLLVVLIWHRVPQPLLIVTSALSLAAGIQYLTRKPLP